MSAPKILRPRVALATIVWLAAAVARAQDGEPTLEEEVSMTMTFVNQIPDTPIELFWENKFSDERKSEGTIEPRGGFLDVKTFVGHEFSYEVDGSRHYVTAPPPNAFGQQFAIVAGNTQDIRVRCSLQREINAEEEGLLSPDLEIDVHPYWAPRGASRFLELVRAGYYDGVAMNRVVPEFLTQFGIARDFDVRTEWDERTIPDDMAEGRDRPFEPGFVSFAGGGPDSRTTEIFIVMPGTSQEQLDYFGTNEWETPFGTVAGSVEDSVMSRIYDGYGDMPPWGNGPDPDEIYAEDGYTTYLPENFPLLDYIDRCFIVEEAGLEDLAAEL